MRNTAPLMMIAATLAVAAPAAAQDTNNTMDATTSGNAVGTGNTMDTQDATATAPTNGLTAGPGAVPETLPPAAVDTTTEGMPADDGDDDGGFPWGLLGLLGLVGLIPRKGRRDSDSGAR